MNFKKKYLGVGKTLNLNLRISVANLAQVFFIDPRTKALKMVLEHNALFNDGDVRMDLRPFGGGCKLLRPDKLYEVIGSFNFDCLKNFNNDDFRIYIKSDDWTIVRNFCLNSFWQHDGYIESSVSRELSEEMQYSGINISSNSYHLQDIGPIVQSEEGEETINTHACGALTKRIFNIQNVQIKDDQVIQEILDHVEQKSLEYMRAKSLEKKKTINGVFVLDLETLKLMADMSNRGEEEIIINETRYRISTNIPDIIKTREMTKILDNFIPK